jgi:hypothetical protein
MTIVEILTWLLEFNPYLRCSAAELLKSSLFDPVRNHQQEKSAPFKIKLEIDRDASFDY